MSETTNLQRDQQGVAESENAFGAQLDGRLKELHTSMPASVVSYDSAKQTCSVVPSVQRVFDGAPMTLPVCVDCPVIFPQSGGYVMTFPIKPGDEVYLMIAERCIDNWYASGGNKPPAEYRMHDLSDGFVLPGIGNQTRNYASVATNGVEIRNRSGSVRVRLDDAGAITQQTGSASTVLSADGKFTINAPGGMFVNGTQSNSSTLAVAGVTTLAAALQVNGLASMNASAAVTGSLRNNTVDVGGTHIHRNTKPGNPGEFSGIPAA